MTPPPDDIHALPLVDVASLAALLELEASGSDALVLPMLELFEGDVPRRLAMLAEALRLGDRSSGAIHAHAIKGSSGALGLARASGLAARLEARLKAPPEADEDLDGALFDLRRTIAESIPALQALIPRLSL